MFRLPSNRGQALILLLVLIVIVGAGFLAGGFVFKDKPEDEKRSLVSTMCCDSGDGEKCVPSDTKTFDWKGTNDQPEKYGLLKSNIKLLEGSGHLELSSERDPEGRPVFMNITDKAVTYCRGGQMSQTNDNLRDPNSPNGGFDSVSDMSGCIPNDELIYVCTNCPDSPNPDGGVGTFDAYYRISDGQVPTPISYCSKAPVAITGGPKANKFVSEADENLQLQTLTFSAPDVMPWLSPWCKPAVYLYPETTTSVNVKVRSSQALTYTDPTYPQGGWQVISNPNGDITYRNSNYDYLYYETHAQDSDYTKPEKGYIVTKNELPTLLTTLLPKLGLNVKETQQFKEYWSKVLPDSAYYFIGVMQQEALDRLATLDVNPKPQTVIRVSLYFEKLDKKISIQEPKIITPLRSGFTVVEWGGIYKKHANESFSCFM